MTTSSRGTNKAHSALLLCSLFLVSVSSFPLMVKISSGTTWTPWSSSNFSTFRHNKSEYYASSSSSSSRIVTRLEMNSDWSSFKDLDDSDDDYDADILGKVDTAAYAVEDDSPEYKAQIGAERAGPSIERDAEPIQVPAGSQLELSEETVLGVLSAMRGELGTLFGYTAENRGVGITGGVDFVEMDGPTVVIKIKGRFWHQRTTVLNRVANYLQQRIPEIIDVTVDDPWSLTDEANAVDF